LFSNRNLYVPADIVTIVFKQKPIYADMVTIVFKQKAIRRYMYGDDCFQTEAYT